MVILTDAEILAVSGGVTAYFTGLAMEKCGFSIESTLALSATIESASFYFLSPLVALCVPAYVFSLVHLIPAAAIGAGLGYVGYLGAQAEGMHLHLFC